MDIRGCKPLACYELTGDGHPRANGGDGYNETNKPPVRELLWTHGTSTAISRHYKKPNSIGKFLESLIGIHDPSRGSALRRHQ